MSFSLVLADKDRSNRIKLDRVGPKPAGQCQGYTFPSPFVYKAAIYADEHRVYGIRFLSTRDATDIGSLRGTPILEEFSPQSMPIGFYGSYTEAGITSLGFLTHDPSCVKEVVDEPEPEPVVPVAPVIEIIEIEESPAEESSGSLGLILGISLGLAVVIGLIVGLIIFLRRRKRRQNETLGTVAPAAGKSTAKESKIGDNIEMSSKGQKGVSHAVIRQDLPNGQANDDNTDDDHIEIDEEEAKQNNDSRRQMITQETDKNAKPTDK